MDVVKTSMSAHNVINNTVLYVVVSKAAAPEETNVAKVLHALQASWRD